MFCVVTLNAQTWYIGSPVATDIEATLNGGILTISGTGKMQDFTGGIPQPWESQQSSIFSVIIEEGVTSIGEWAFGLCKELNSAVIPESVVAIGISSFRESGIRSVTIIGNSLKKIDDAAFYICENLESITIPESVESIESFAFQKSGIQSVTILGNSLKKIGVVAFASCVNLKSIILPASVEEIGMYSFRESGISSITFSGNSLKTIDYGAFYECLNLESITIPESVEIIGEWVFGNCYNLSEIINYVTTPLTVLNNTFNGVDLYNCRLRVPVKSIEDYREAAGWSKFNNIEPIESIVGNGSIGSISWSLYSNGVLVFSGTGDIPYIIFNDYSLKSISNDVQDIVITEGITGIINYGLAGSRAFSVSIPASVTKIGTLTFSGCTNLVSISVHTSNPEYSSSNGVLFNKDSTVLHSFPGGKTSHYTIPSSVNSIGAGAFDRCRLPSVTISSSVKTIETDAFTFCHNLTSITIPSTVTYIAGNVVLGCSNMTSIEVDPGNPNYSSSADGVLFNVDKTAIIAVPSGKPGEYNIPSSVKTISNAAFMYCQKLSSVNIPNSVETVGNRAFFACTSLGPLNIPASVTKILNDAFSRCYTLTSISVHEDNEHFCSEDGVLYTKDKATLLCVPSGRQGNYLVPESVKIIEGFAFYSCEKLSSVIFQGAQVFLDNRTFAECGSLTEIIHLNTTPQVIPVSLFPNTILSNSKLLVPAASVSLYRANEQWGKFNTIEGMDVIALDYSALCLLTGTEKTLMAILDEHLPETQIDWTSANTVAATINSTGKVTAVKPGTADITVSAYGHDAICAVTVLEPGNSTIKGTVDNAGTSSVRVNLYVKLPDTDTKKGIIGGYVLLATTVPNDNGEYKFEDLPEGSYKVDVEMDEYESEMTPAINLSGNETRSNINFEVDGTTGTVTPKIVTGAVETWHAASLQIYPNPFTDIVRIAVQTGHAPSLRMQIINASGAIVHTQIITNPDETIHLGHLPAGMYIIRLENGKTVKVIKIQ